MSILSALLLLLESSWQKIDRERRYCWAHDLYVECEKYGKFHTLYEDRLNDKRFWRYVRMSIEGYTCYCSKTEHKLSKNADTQLKIVQQTIIYGEIISCRKCLQHKFDSVCLAQTCRTRLSLSCTGHVLISEMASVRFNHVPFDLQCKDTFA